MPKYRVVMKEVHEQPVEVEADDAKQALQRAKDGEGEVLINSLEYLWTMDSELWDVEEIKES